jgi:transcriptional regulator with XRE-family HTH domain
LACSLGLKSHSHIAKLERGEAPSLALAVRIACLLEVSTDALLRDSIPVEAVDIPLSATFQKAETVELIDFGRRMRTLRLHHQLSQRELAHQLGVVSRSYISDLEAGHKYPSVDVAVRMADLFDVTIDVLLINTPDTTDTVADAKNTTSLSLI